MQNQNLLRIEIDIAKKKNKKKEVVAESLQVLCQFKSQNLKKPNGRWENQRIKKNVSEWKKNVKKIFLWNCQNISEKKKFISTLKICKENDKRRNDSSGFGSWKRAREV